MRKLIPILCALCALLSCVFSLPCRARAAEAGSLEAAAQERRSLPIQSNETPGWPDGPAISAQAAILMEADTGTVLYAKNIHEELYPASTTKILTCLLAVESADLGDEVVVSDTAAGLLPPGSSNIGLDPGEALTLEQALYGILVGSANEVSNAVAEHVAGSIPAFVERMNERARELGCTESHFANTNGLPDEAHHTSAHDLAMIARAFFDNALLSRISGTATYHFAPTPRQKDDFTIRNKHKLVNGEIPCQGIVGGKTGYTDAARETLVTCARRDNMRLIAVVLMEESPAQFTDTVTLFEYGFNNFRRVDISREETRLLPPEPPFLTSSYDVFGNSDSVLSYAPGAAILLPSFASLEETDIAVRPAEDVWARAEYTWNGASLGSVAILSQKEPSPDPAPEPVVTIRLFRILPIVYGAAAAYSLAACLFSLLRSTYFGGLTLAERRRLRRDLRKRRHEKLHLE